jgi:hypothetical protein
MCTQAWERSQVQGTPSEMYQGRTDNFSHVKERSGFTTQTPFFKLIRWFLKNQIQMSAKMNSS